MTRLVANGKIIWLKEESRGMVGRYLIGVKFHDLKPQDTERIRAFIQERLGTAA